MTPRPITKPAKPIKIPTSTQILAWTSLAMVASIVLQVIVGG